LNWSLIRGTTIPLTVREFHRLALSEPFLNFKKPVESIVGHSNAVEAFMDLSRRAGADAVIVERPASGLSIHARNEAQIEAAANNGSERAVEQTQNSTISADDLAPNRRYLFQATAVVWDNKPLNPAPSSPLPSGNTNTIVTPPPSKVRTPVGKNGGAI
jgi:hypothetical protein